MLTLAVDTSTRMGSLAVLRDDALLGQIADDSGEPYSSSLCRDAEALLRNAGISLNQLDVFAVAAGPGSFTGLRVGLTAVKAWAEVLGKPIVAVSALEAIAAQVKPGQGADEGFDALVPVFDGSGGQIFGAVYRYGDDQPCELTPMGEAVAAEAGEFLRSVSEQASGLRLVVATPTPEIIAAALARSPLDHCRIEQTSLVLAPSIGLLGYRKALRGLVTDALGLDANYVRRPDAEQKWKDG